MRFLTRVRDCVFGAHLHWLVPAGVALVYALWGGYVVARNKTIDFYVYYTGGLAVRHGYDILRLSQEEYRALGGFPGYAEDEICYQNRYPPFFNLAMVPWTLMPPRAAAAVWTGVSILAFLGAVWVLARALDGGRASHLIWVLAGLSLPALATLHAGQVNLFVLLFLAAAFAAVQRGRTVRAGLALGVAASLKLSPAALIPYILWRKQWKTALVAALVLAAALTVSIPLVGVGQYVSFVQNRRLISLSDVLVLTPTNQSLSGLIGRLSVALPAPEEVYLQAIWIVRLVLVGATIGLCWPPGAAPTRLRLEYGLAIAALLLILPFAWFHLLVLLLVPQAVLAQRLCTRGGERWLIVPLAVAALLQAIHGLFWHQLPAWQPYGLQVSGGTYAALIIWGTLAALLVKERRAARRRAPDAGAAAANEER